MFRKIGVQFATLAIVAMIFSVQGLAQYPKTRPEQTQDQTQERTQADRETRSQTKQPTTFYERAVELNQAEIQFGNLAMNKAEDMRVRDYAEMTVRDHTQMLNRLQGTTETTSTIGRTEDMRTESRQKPEDSTDQSALQVEREKPSAMTADRMDRGMLTRDHQQALDRLENLSGEQFDREYINLMVREHRSAIQMYEREARMSGTRQEKAPSTRPESSTSTMPAGIDTKKIAREDLPILRRHLSEAQQIQKQLQSTQR